MTWGEVKNHFFHNMIMLHINLKRMKHTTACKQLFFPYIPSTSGVGSKVKTSEFGSCCISN